MSIHIASAVDRRSFLVGSSALGLSAALLPAVSRGSTGDVRKFSLTAVEKRLPLVGAPYPETDVWCYNSSVPGPELRARQGERVRIEVANELADATTVHWHGLRVPNAMDGVPFLTQKPIATGERFVYEFDLPDAGTYWYHPHHHSSEQVGRGLAGALIVEEADPLPVDRDIVWVLGDWRLTRDASIVADFGNRMDAMMAGRIGNTVTINGRVPDPIPVRHGERWRIRLINAAPARIFGLEFEKHRPFIVAHDGQPVEPYEPPGGRVVLGPAMRADVVLDMGAEGGGKASVVDRFYGDRGYKLVDLVYGSGTGVGSRSNDPPRRIAANTMPEPDLDRAERHTAALQGGMMGGRGMTGMRGPSGPGMSGMAWSINGVAAREHDMAPMLTLTRGRSYIVEIRNDTAFHHPIHLHGHSFRVIARNGRRTRRMQWMDTVLIPPKETADIAFVADNPGDWMFHCHILDHQDRGMMAVIRVA